MSPSDNVCLYITFYTVKWENLVDIRDKFSRVKLRTEGTGLEGTGLEEAGCRETRLEGTGLAGTGLTLQSGKAGISQLDLCCLPWSAWSCLDRWVVSNLSRCSFQICEPSTYREFIVFFCAPFCSAHFSVVLQRWQSQSFMLALDVCLVAGLRCRQILLVGREDLLSLPLASMGMGNILGMQQRIRHSPTASKDFSEFSEVVNSPKSWQGEGKWDPIVLASVSLLACFLFTVSWRKA